jgi:hypothetical protein
MIALLEQGITADDSIQLPACMPVEVDPSSPADAFIEAARLRATGARVVMTRGKEGDE